MLYTETCLFLRLLYRFANSYLQVRRLSLEVCCCFTLPLVSLPEEVEVIQTGVYSICLEADLVEANVHVYRDKLVHLRKLEHGVVQHQLYEPAELYDKVP